MKKLRRLKGVKPVRPTQPEGATYPELDNLRSTLKELQLSGLQNKQMYLATETAILDFCKRVGIGRDGQGGKYDRGPGQSVTTVYGSTEVVNWEGIRKKLKPEYWKLLLGEPQPDKRKLEALIEAGIIDGNVIEPFVTSKPSKPYVTLT